MSCDTLSCISLSGGKDSSALALLTVEKGMPIDVVITAETGMDFPEMSEHLAKLDAILFRERGIHITTLRHPHSFEWLMFDRPINRTGKWKDMPPHSYGGPGVNKRWRVTIHQHPPIIVRCR